MSVRISIYRTSGNTASSLKRGEMKMRTQVAIAIGLSLLFIATTGLQMQASKSPIDFVIDASRPFVYIEFDRIGPGEPWSPDEAPTRIWLHLRNNCRIPITVLANGVPDDSPKDEVGLMYDVVANPPSQMVVLFDTPLKTPRKPKASSEKTAPATEEQEIPRGRLADVGSSISIPPAKAILFSIPTNHISEHWHIDIRFQFDLPDGKKKCCHDPEISPGPDLSIAYHIWDLPPVERAKIDK